MVVQCPDCPLHQINLGMWIHTMQAIVAHMVDFLRKPLKQNGKPVVSKVAVKEVGEEARRRLATWSSATHGFQIPKKAQHFVEDLISCGADGNISDYCTIEAKTHQLLMMVFIVMYCSL